MIEVTHIQRCTIGVATTNVLPVDAGEYRKHSGCRPLQMLATKVTIASVSGERGAKLGSDLKLIGKSVAYRRICLLNLGLFDMAIRVRIA